MGPVLDPGVPLCAPPFQYHLRPRLGSSRYARWRLCCLPYFPPFDWKLWWSVPAARYKYLFLPLLGSLLSFFLIISVSFDPAFPLLTTRSTLFRGAKNQIFSVRNRSGVHLYLMSVLNVNLTPSFC
jgi:hypothetical protein